MFDWLSTWCARRGKTTNPIVAAVMRQSSIRMGLGAPEHPAPIFRTEAPSKPAAQPERAFRRQPSLHPRGEPCALPAPARSLREAAGNRYPHRDRYPQAEGGHELRFSSPLGGRAPESTVHEELLTMKSKSSFRWRNRSGRFQFVRRTTTLATPISSTSSSQSQSWALRSTWPLAF